MKYKHLMSPTFNSIDISKESQNTLLGDRKAKIKKAFLPGCS